MKHILVMAAALAAGAAALASGSPSSTRLYFEHAGASNRPLPSFVLAVALPPEAERVELLGAAWGRSAEVFELGSDELAWVLGRVEALGAPATAKGLDYGHGAYHVTSLAAGGRAILQLEPRRSVVLFRDVAQRTATSQPRLAAFLDALAWRIGGVERPAPPQ